MKFRILAVPLMLSLGLLPGIAQALGLGDLTLRSHLNEPLDAEIQLLSPGKLSANEILPSLAGDAEFKRARMERFFHLSSLRYEVVRGRSGALVIRVTTEQPVTEPFLNFLLELNWPTGRILREYTILLDPVPFARTRPKPVVRTVTQAPKQVSEPATPAPRPAPKPAATTSRPRTAVATAPAPVKKKRSGSFTGDSYGPVKARDTLWKIASRVRPSGVSMNQTMLAIQRANPEAFLNNNINLLRRGVTLTIPTADQIRSTSNEQAGQEVLRQERQWKIDRGVAAPAPAPAPEKPAETANLKLVTPSAKTTAETTSAAGGSAAAEMIPADEDVTTQLAVAKESLDKVARDKADAETRAEELQAQLETLQKLLTLKDAQLASLQNRLGEEGTASADVSATKELAPSGMTADVAADAVDGMDSMLGRAADTLTPEGMTDSATAVDGMLSEATDAVDGLAEAAMDAMPADMGAITDPMDASVMTPAEPAPEIAPAPEVVPAAPTPAPAPVQQQPTPVAEKTFIEKVLANPTAVAGAGGAGILALLGGLFVLRKRGKGKKVEADSLLTPATKAAGAATAATAASAASATSAASAAAKESFEPSLASLPEVGDKKEQELDDLLGATEGLIADEAPAAEAEAAVPSLDELSQELTADIAGTREEDTLVPSDSEPQTTIADLEDELDAELDALSGLADETDLGATPESETPTAETVTDTLQSAGSGVEEAFGSLDLESESPELATDLETDLSLGDAEADLGEIAETFEDTKLAEVSLDEALPEEDVEKDLDALSAELDDLTFEAPAETADTTPEPALGEELDLGLEAATEETMAETTAEAADLNLDEELDFLGVEDEAATKIDLARAYMDMGDLEGAREILDEVVIEGNDAQKAEAKSLLNKL